MKISRIVAASVAAVGLVVGGIAISNAAVRPDCKNLMYPLCPRSVAATQVVDNSLPKSKIVPADRDAFLKDTNTPDVKGGATVVDVPATVVEKIGGSFKTNKTKAAEFDLPAGTWKLDMSYFCGRTVAAATPGAGTRLMMALRVGATSSAFGDDYGTVIGQQISDTKDREITAANFKYMTTTSTQHVEVFFFGYNDDTSGAGGNEVTCSGQVGLVRS